MSGHCQNNPTGHDHIYLPEIKEIAGREFGKLIGPPCSSDLGFAHGDEYDDLIRGWTKYWNEMLQAKDPLDADLVKALIATESGFDAQVKRRAGKKAGWARGLMQVTDATQRTLRDEHGELHDFFVNLNQRDMTDPNANLVAGIRWLFRKKETASAKLKREATWEEAIADYNNRERKKVNSILRWDPSRDIAPADKNEKPPQYCIGNSCSPAIPATEFFKEISVAEYCGVPKAH